MLSFLKQFLFFILATLFALEQVKAYSITFQSVTCNVLSASITLESWEYLQGSYIQLYTDIQSASTNANSWYFQMGFGSRYTSSSLTNQVKFINNRFTFFTGKSSVAIGIADSNGNLLPYQGSGDPDIATLNFSPPQGCSTPIVSSSSSTTSIFRSTSSISTITRSSSSTSTSSTSPINRFTTTTTSPFHYSPTPTPYPIYDDNKHTNKHTNTGAIAGGVVGGVVVLILLILLAFCIRRRKKDENNIAPLGFTQSNSNRGSNLTQPDIEKDPQSSAQHDKSIEECEVVVLEKDDHSKPLQNQHNTSNDSRFINRTTPIDYTSRSSTRPDEEKAEGGSWPENPLLKHLHKIDMK